MLKHKFAVIALYSSVFALSTSPVHAQWHPISPWAFLSRVSVGLVQQPQQPAPPPAQKSPDENPNEPGTPGAKPLFGGDEGGNGQDGGSEPIIDFGKGQPILNLNGAAPPGAAAAASTTTAATGAEKANVHLAFNNTDLSQVILQLQVLAGKPVIPSPTISNQPTKVTLISDAELTKTAALDLLVQTLFDYRIAVIDRGQYIAVNSLTDLHSGEVPLVGPDVSLLGRTGTGWVVEKIFQIKYGKAKTISDSLANVYSTDIKMTVNEDANQIIAIFNVGTLQRMERDIAAIDTPNNNLKLQTYYLKYNDAEVVSKLILGLYGQSDDQNNDNNRQQRFFRPQQQREGQSNDAATSAHLTVVTNKQLNSVSVRAEPAIVDQITNQIQTVWDVALPPNIVVPRIYHMENSDAVQMKNLLNSLFAQDTNSQVDVNTGEFFFGNGGNQQQNRNSRQTSGNSGENVEGPKISPIAGMVSFDADKSKNNLIVTCRSAEYIPAIEKLIKSFDQPTDVNLPKVYELKYAEAEDLADRLNALLAQTGTGDTQIQKQSQDLTSTTMISPLSQNTNTNQNQNTGQQTNTNTEKFPWQTGSPDPNARPITPLIGQVRIMPWPRQNALMVLSPPEMRDSIGRLIEILDKPGRQVLIQAVILEASVDDALALGLRVGSNSVLDTANPDNHIGIGTNITGEKNNLIRSLFDTSVLNASVDLNMAIQALAQKTKVNILFRPKVVTSDNEEANFFDGQDIPFLTSSQTTDVGGNTQNFEYVAVGIQLSVRPHITVEGNVDLRVNLQLSSVVPGQTLFGGAILDRRETTTKVTVMDQQTVVISGIFRTQTNDILRKVPLIGDIPIIGGLFRSTDKSATRTELFALIRPIVLENPDRLYHISQPDVRRLNSVQDDINQQDHSGFQKLEPLPVASPANVQPGSSPQNQQPQNQGAGTDPIQPVSTRSLLKPADENQSKPGDSGGSSQPEDANNKKPLGTVIRRLGQ